ncbi:apolipoprotein N-acyltransferase [Oceanicella sp. SM1341]|uniref:apolipoprotein N-acyltransferase n=1 Tax=Oceanicella sp. SM1341 TaxID=1548889 RepID=UPI001E49E730|nr:apolipoprotein N-acyltransferase [Oceanicella sp. SM1341]
MTTLSETAPRPAAWPAGLGRWPRLGLAFACGVALTLAQPPLSLWPLCFLAVPLLLMLTGSVTRPVQAGWTAWAAGTGFFATGLYWIAEAFLVDIARHGWMAPFAILGLAGGLALFWALPFWVAARLRLAGPWRLLAIAALWTLSEYARSHVLTGFPWALPGYAWVETPLAQTASLFGPHMLGFLGLAVSGAPLIALRGRGATRIAVPLAALALLAAGWAWGSARLAAPAPQRETPFVVRMVQPNAPQNEKWRGDLIPVFFERLRTLSNAPGPVTPGVVIWPETAVPWLLAEDPRARLAIASSAQGAPVIVGARKVDEGPRGRRIWSNSLFALDASGAILGSYDKHHLVPFGEYVPLNGLLAGLGLEGFVGGSFSPGPGPVVMSLPGVPDFLPLICYEAIFPHEMQADRRPEWIVQITNDAWFGSSAGPYQHFAQARMRAIEQGLPFARAANTGISAMIDPMGRIVAKRPLLEQGYVDTELPAPLGPTLYARAGDLPWVALVVFLGLTGIVLCRKFEQ